MEIIEDRHGLKSIIITSQLPVESWYDAIGDPTVAGATVTASVVEEGKDKKVIVYKYKRKTGYHKKNGHRQLFTKVKIESINA